LGRNAAEMQAEGAFRVIAEFVRVLRVEEEDLL
jgi:hypothetical protein